MICKMGQVLLEQTCSTLPWILDQCQNDNITVPIIAKGGEIVEVSKLLIAVISPLIGDIMKSDVNTFQDFVILVPDVDMKCIIHLIEKIVSMSPSPPDKETIHELTGIFWNYNLFENNQIEVKAEEDSVFDFETPVDDIDQFFNQGEDNMSIYLMPDENISISKCYVKLERIKTEIKTEAKQDKPKILKSGNMMKRRKKPRKSACYRARAPPLPDGRKRPLGRPPGIISNPKHSSDEDSDNGRKKIKKPKLEELYNNPINDTKLPISALTERRYKGKRFTKPMYKHESEDEDSDPEIIHKIKIDRERGEKNDSDFEVNVKSEESDNGWSLDAYYPIKETDLPKDEKFLSAHQKLKEALIDENNLKEVEFLWHELRNLGKIFLYKRRSLIDDKLICPLCLVVFKHPIHYFKHLTRHKVDNYKCECDLSADQKIDDDKKQDTGSSARYHHLLKHHWGYLDCSHCDLLVRSDKMDKHLRMKHKIKPTCPECPKTIFKNSATYIMHMEEHRAEKFDCDCRIFFQNRKFKIHHIQSVHVKELQCCDQCYHVAVDVKSLNHHKRKEHTKVDEKPKDQIICDICGYVYVIPKGHSYDAGLKRIKEHKMMQHDVVLVPCPDCSKMVKQVSLKQHMKTHIKEICSVCGKEVQKQYLKKHLAAHNDQWLHTCSHCSKGFTTKHGMDSHIMNVHLKLRPYKCRYGCEFAYNDSSNRNQHEKKKHGGIFTKQQSPEDGLIKQT